MRVNRFFVDQALHTTDEVRLDAEASHHLTRVLRLRPGAHLRVFDGAGAEFEATLVSATRRGARLSVEESVANDTESALRLTLAQGISRGERMDLVMQKATELGVARIAPLLTERSVVRLDAERRARRAAHWRRVAISACEQSGRSRLPVVDEPLGFEQWLDAMPAGGTRLTLRPGAAKRVRDLGRPADDQATIVIGPEGGLSPREKESLETEGFVPVSLGPRTLRTETAALAILAALQSHWGDL